MNNTKSFETKLRALCIAYDNKYGEYRESSYEGMALFEFFVKNGCEESPTFAKEHCEHWWNEMEERVTQSAMKEMKKREAIANLNPMPIDRDLDLGI